MLQCSSHSPQQAQGILHSSLGVVRALKTGCCTQLPSGSPVHIKAGCLLNAQIFQAECAVASSSCLPLLQGGALLSDVAPGVCWPTMQCHLQCAGKDLHGGLCHSGHLPTRCRYWHSGRCLYGDHCRFAHPATPAPAAPPATQPVCRYWRFGTCRYGPACRFRWGQALGFR